MKKLEEMAVEELDSYVQRDVDINGHIYWDHAKKAMDELARRLAKAGCPEEWVCVPREPTFAMWEDMHDALVRYCVDGKTVTEAWNAAIKAVPKEDK